MATRLTEAGDGALRGGVVKPLVLLAVVALLVAGCSTVSPQTKPAEQSETGHIDPGGGGGGSM